MVGEQFCAFFLLQAEKLHKAVILRAKLASFAADVLYLVSFLLQLLPCLLDIMLVLCESLLLNFGFPIKLSLKS